VQQDVRRVVVDVWQRDVGRVGRGVDPFVALEEGRGQERARRVVDVRRRADVEGCGGACVWAGGRVSLRVCLASWCR
jgi:hypothetical protein